MSGLTSVQIIDEIERVNRTGLKGYESPNEEKLKNLASNHGKLFARAQEAARAELRAAEKLETRYMASGHNWTPDQVKNAIDRIATHVHTSLKIQSSALGMRGNIFKMFNNMDNAATYNPARFFRLSKAAGAEWLQSKGVENHVKDFTPSHWKLITYGSPNKPRTTLGGHPEHDSFVKKSYSEVYAKRHETSGIPKIADIQAALSRALGRAPKGTIQKAPGGWLQNELTPSTIGQ